MDSLTQFVLGAAVAEATIGRRAGRMAALTGGVIATLPDLDVLVSLGDPVSDFTYHRSATHSLLLLTLAAPCVAWLVCRLRQAWRTQFKAWLLTTWLILITHPLLDALTVYGTQLLWPLSEHPFGVGSIFIIDPLYTLPLLGAVVAAQFVTRQSGRSTRIACLALGATTLYLMAGFAAQQKARADVLVQLAAQSLPTERVGVWNTPFNILAWRVVAVGEDAYHVGYYSLLGRGQIAFERFASRPELLKPVRDAWHVQRLTWFSKGFYVVGLEDERIVVRDLRMGLEPDHYAFSFAVAQRNGNAIVAMAPERVAAAPYRSEDWLTLRDNVLGRKAGP